MMNVIRPKAEIHSYQILPASPMLGTTVLLQGLTVYFQETEAKSKDTQPGLSRPQKVIFAASCKNFCIMRKIFCSPIIFAIFVKTHFFIQHLISKVFEKIMRLVSNIFAW